MRGIEHGIHLGITALYFFQTRKWASQSGRMLLGIAILISGFIQIHRPFFQGVLAPKIRRFRSFMVINFSSIFLIGGGGILAHCSWKVNCLMVGFFGVTHHLLSYRPSYEYIDGVICQAKLLMGEAKKATQLSEAIDKLKELENLRKKTNSFSCLASQMLGIYCKTYLDVNKKFKVEKSSFEEAVNKEWLSRLETQFNLTLNKKKVYHFCLNLIKFL